MRYEAAQVLEMVRRAALRSGASDDVAVSLSKAVLAAEWAGRRSVGLEHLPDYLDGFRTGRIAGDAKPQISFPAPALIRVDAKGGIAQLGFDRAFDEIVERATRYGVALLAQTNSYTVGELGYYTRRLAEAGLVSLAACNASPQMTTLESRKAVFGTNPLSFAAPMEDRKPFVIDQASSETAFVNVRRAAAQGEAIPAGWALDATGAPTTDAREAVRGLLLAFGGNRGANIALIVEILAAGLTGANWSMDAGSFSNGSESPAIGLLIVAIKPDLLAPGFALRLSLQIERLATRGVRIPGSQTDITELDLPASLVAGIEGS